MSNRSISSGILGLIFLSCSVPVRSAQKFPDYPVRRPSDSSISLRQDDVSIGLVPVESVEDQMSYFHTALSPKGFLPVLVVVHNISKFDSLLLDKGGISSGMVDSAQTAPKENTAGQKTAIASASLIPFIGPFISMGMAKDASEVKQNMLIQELHSRTLSPGDTAHGFLYIPIPKKGPRPKIHLQLPIAWAGSDKTSVLNFNF